MNFSKWFSILLYIHIEQIHLSMCKSIYFVKNQVLSAGHYWHHSPIICKQPKLRLPNWSDCIPPMSPIIHMITHDLVLPIVYLNWLNYLDNLAWLWTPYINHLWSDKAMGMKFAFHRHMILKNWWGFVSLFIRPNLLKGM